MPPQAQPAASVAAFSAAAACVPASARIPCVCAAHVCAAFARARSAHEVVAVHVTCTVHVCVRVCGWRVCMLVPPSVTRAHGRGPRVAAACLPLTRQHTRVWPARRGSHGIHDDEPAQWRRTTAERQQPPAHAMRQWRGAGVGGGGWHVCCRLRKRGSVLHAGARPASFVSLLLNWLHRRQQRRRRGCACCVMSSFAHAWCCGNADACERERGRCV